MARKEKHWEDDDGRTIADMSQVKRPSLFGNLPGSAYQREEQPEEREEAKKSPPWVDNSLSKQDRHAFFFGTMKASLLICAAYLVGFGVFILILTLLFRGLRKDQTPKGASSSRRTPLFIRIIEKMGGLS